MKAIIGISCLALLAALCTPAAAETDCSVHPDPVDPRTCCPFPELFSSEIMEKCKEFDTTMRPPPSEESSDDARPHPRPHPHPHPPHHHPCYTSCMFNETGILNTEQKLDETKLHEYLTSQFKNEEQVWIPIVETAFKTCAVKGEEMRAKWQAHKESKAASNGGEAKRMHHFGCPLDSKFLLGCVFMEVFPNCPSDFWNDNEQCNTLRDFMKDCKPHHLGFMGKRKHHGSGENSA